MDTIIQLTLFALSFSIGLIGTIFFGFMAGYSVVLILGTLGVI